MVTKLCECGCEGTFECKINSKQRFIYGHSNRGKFNPNSNERKEAQLVECFLNHKVISVEWLKEKEEHEKELLAEILEYVEKFLISETSKKLRSPFL